MSDYIMHDPDAKAVEETAARIEGLLRREEGQQWRWAEVAAAAPNEDVLRAAAEQAGFFETHAWPTLKHWRHVGLAWPEDKREPATSFTAHAELASVQPDEKRFALMKPGLSKREARRLSGRKAMKDDVDAGLERMLDDETNEDLILEKALQIEARRNELVLGRQAPSERASAYLRAAGYITQALTALSKGIELAQDLKGDERDLVLEQIKEIETKAAHASALTLSVPDALPDDFGQCFGDRRAK